jgi:hypothetical protein
MGVSVAMERAIIKIRIFVKESGAELIAMKSIIPDTSFFTYVWVAHVPSVYVAIVSVI